MTDDQIPGRRKDGKPFAEGNTREDGSYAVGHARTPSHSRFAAGDGRPRGRRKKGVKNLATDFAEELAQKITIVEGGVKKTVTKQRGLVKSLIDRGMKRSDRAVETALRYAPQEEVDRGLSLSDREVLEAWLAQQLSTRSGDDDDLPATDAER